jgi:hypothetical protein
MNETATKIRRRTLIWMGGGALLALVLGGASMMPPAPPKARGETGKLVLPDFAAHAADVNLVMVTTSSESYHLVRNPSGWVLPEKGGYPVRADRIAALVSALGAMRYDRAMTRDDKKFDRIGLGDPAQGGTGALLEVGDGHGNTFAKLIVGYRDGHTYVREPDDLQAWATTLPADAVMPPLQRGARWLDLEAATIPADAIAQVDVRTGLSTYRLIPVDATGSSFALAPPNNLRTAAGFGLALVAQALTRFSPSDVAPSDKVHEEGPVSIHTTRTKAGLEITAHAWRSGGKAWVSLSAVAAKGAAPDVVTQADAINARAKGWAFQMTETDWGVFVTPLDQLTMK